MDCIAKTASFSSLAWRPCARLRMRSIAITLKVNEKQVGYEVLCVQWMYNVCMIDIISRELPCIVYMLVIAAFYFFLRLEA